MRAESGSYGESPSANGDARTFNAVRQLVAMGEEVWITVTGRSMEPTLRAGDRVLLRPAQGAWRAGRVVLSEFLGRPVLHRLVRVGADDATTAGDACRFEDPAVPRSALVAEAVAVQTSSGVVPLRPTLRFGIVPLLPYARAILRQRVRRAGWRVMRRVLRRTRGPGGQ